jgi:DNA-binding SARP family transcriptional activator
VTTFSVLGSIECWSGQRLVEISGTLQRTLLAALLANESKPVAAEHLMQELWQTAPPRHWENALQAHVSRLRRRLASVADDRPARLVVQPSGYRLLVDPDAMDATTFMRAFTRARAVAGTDPAEAAGQLRSALALWHGPAFGNVIGGPMCRAAAARYEGARLVALETLFDLELRVGRHSDIIPALRELVESPSLNERFCEQLMIALYRSGLQTDALATYRRMRQRLDLELGVKPTNTLRNLEKAILAHDPSLQSRADHLVLRA